MCAKDKCDRDGCVTCKPTEKAKHKLIKIENTRQQMYSNKQGSVVSLSTIARMCASLGAIIPDFKLYENEKGELIINTGFKKALM